LEDLKAVNSKGFWKWYIIQGTAGCLDFVRCPVFHLFGQRICFRSPLKVNRCFGELRFQRVSRCYFLRWVILGLWRRRRNFPPKTSVDSRRTMWRYIPEEGRSLHNPTATTSNPTWICFHPQKNIMVDEIYKPSSPRVLHKYRDEQVSVWAPSLLL
jgi:hypothetical protein